MTASAPTGPPARPGPVDLYDGGLVAVALGRAPQGGYTIAVRLPEHLDGTGPPVPAVIENAPFLDDGTPMPTRFWLVHPEIVRAVSRLESAGGVRQSERAVPPEALAEAHRRYALERDARVPPGHVGPRPSGGVGGTRRGVKCLHAHYAWLLAGGDDPVGRWVEAHLTGAADTEGAR